ncbi:MAG: hypothetical protein OEV40_03165 [Acidimicrobiia bacterium]|nr:hypothetical protein [Acidimicrobiia bacterium]
MPPPSTHLERTRGHILGESERVRAASRVRLLDGIETLGVRTRGRLLLALTDRRLLLVAEARRAARSRLLAEWTIDGVKLAVSRPKLGNNIIEVRRHSERILRAEWAGGHEARVWAGLRYRLRDPGRPQPVPDQAIVNPPDTESV